MADPGPLFLNRPRALTTYSNKYAPGSALSSFLDSLYPSTRTALQRFDAARVNTGRPPLTKEETRFAGTAVNEQRAAAPEPSKSLWESFKSDLGDVVSEVPKLPFTLFKEGQAVTQLPETVAGLPDASNPLEQVGNVASLPGVRLIPGSFVASQFAPGGEGVSGLTSHPLFTALDVLPYASKAARLTPTFKAAEEAAQATAAAEGTVPRRVSPFSANLRSFPHTEAPLRPSPVYPGIEVPTLATNRIGGALEAMGDRLAQTGLGRYAARVGGKAALEDTRFRNRLESNIQSSTSEVPLSQFRGDPISIEATRVAREQAPLIAEFRSAMTPERALEVEQIARTRTPESFATLTPEEQAYVRYVEKFNEDFGRALTYEGPGKVPDDRLGRREIGGVEEVYDARTANRLDKLRHQRDAQLAAAHLRDTLDPNTPTAMTREQIVADLNTLIQDSRIRSKQRGPLMRGYLRVLENQGYDVRAARKLLNDNQWFDVPDSIPEVPTREPSITTGTKGNIKSIERAGFTRGRTNAAIRSIDKFEAGAVPARFDELVLNKFDERVRGVINEQLQGAELDKAFSLLERRYYQDLDGMIPNDLQALLKETRSTWQDLRAQGYDPVFEHKVPLGQANRYQFARITGTTPSLKSVKARLWETQPSESNFAVSLSDRAMDYLVNRSRNYYVDNHLVPNMSRSESALRAEYMPAASHAGTGVQSLIAKEWMSLDEALNGWGVDAATTMKSAERRYIPRVIGENLQKLRVEPSDIARLSEKAIKPWRTTIIGLSPRLHLYNTIGGSIMMMGRAENPLTIWKYARAAREMIRETSGTEGLAGSQFAPDSNLAILSDLTDAERNALELLPGGGQEALKFFQDDLPGNTPVNRLAIANNFLAGHKLESLLHQAWDAGATRAIRSGVNWTTAKSMWLNNMTDNFYRSMAFMESLDRGVKSGLSREAAITRAVKSVRETLQNFDTMTPIERTTARFLMPFWSWARTALRYTLTYPVDHPWRTAILASLARAELEDWNTGLPQRLQSYLFLGDTKTDGTVTAINLDGMNPFRDVANWFTLVGFLGGEKDARPGGVISQLNPLIQTSLQSMGVDTFSGGPELYPELRYDPETGGLTAGGGESFPVLAASNLLPPARALIGVSGMSNTYKSIAKNDPAAAGRYLASSLGIPSLRREINVPEETINAELVRYHALRDDVNNSLKAGDLGGLISRYPGLDAFAQRIQTLPTKQLVKYQPQPGLRGSMQPGVADLFREAVSAGLPRP